EPQEAHRRGGRARGAGPQPPAQDAPPDGRHDAEGRRHGQEGPDARRPRGAARQGRRHASRRPRRPGRAPPARARPHAEPRRAAPRHGAAARPLRPRQEEMIPTLTTERLVLRAPTLADFEPYADFFASPRSGWEDGPITRGTAWKEFASVVGQWQLRGY